MLYALRSAGDLHGSLAISHAFADPFGDYQIERKGMRALASIYVSRDQDALGYDQNPESFAVSSQHRNYGPLELSILWSMMRGIEWNAPLLDEFVCLLQRDSGERLIHRIPWRMVSALAALQPQQVTGLAATWGSIEELDWTPDQAKGVMEDLVRLSRHAVASHRTLYLWNGT